MRYSFEDLVLANLEILALVQANLELALKSSYNVKRSMLKAFYLKYGIYEKVKGTSSQLDDAINKCLGAVMMLQCLIKQDFNSLHIASHKGSHHLDFLYITLDTTQKESISLRFKVDKQTFYKRHNGVSSHHPSSYFSSVSKILVLILFSLKHDDIVCLR